MLVLATEVWKSHGGVQRYMMMISRILAHRSEAFSVITLLDEHSDRPGDASSVGAICCRGSKWRFCAEAFRSAITRDARTTIVGHVALLPIAWALRLCRLTDRYAVVLHGTEAWQRLPWLSRLAARRATSIVATTHYTVREFCYYNGLPSTNCIVIPLASNLRPPVDRGRQTSNELKILTVTRLSKSDAYKGVDTILQAVRRGRDLGCRLSLEVVGSGNDMDRLQGLTRSLEIEDIVHFRGSIPDLELQSLLDESHIFAMPSRKEGFGIVFLEAMAAGLPCIGANHGGIPEVIEHGESGFLVEYGDADKLTFYLRALMESRPLYQMMSRAARRRATEVLSYDVMAQSWGSLLDRLNGAGSCAGNEPFVLETR